MFGIGMRWIIHWNSIPTGIGRKNGWSYKRKEEGKRE